MTTELFTEFGDSVGHVPLPLPVPTTPTIAVARYLLTPPPGYPLRFFVALSTGDVSPSSYSHGYIEESDGDHAQLPPGGRTVHTTHSSEGGSRVEGSIWVKVYGRRRASLRLTRDSVAPVFAEFFNATTQNLDSIGTRFPALRHRKDTLSIIVPPSVAGGPSRVWLISSPVETSGGHHHVTGTPVRPSGAFFALNRLSGIDSGRGGRRDSIRVTLAATDSTRIVYRTSGIGGREWIRLRPDSIGQPAIDSVAVSVGIPGLVRVPHSNDFYRVDASTNHPGNDEFLMPGVVELLSNGIWEPYIILHRTFPGAIPLGNDKFRLSASALPQGGTSDIKGNWRYSHQFHRDGLDVDFNNDTTGAIGAEGAVGRAMVGGFCDEVSWEIIPGVERPIRCVWEANHYHVYIVRPQIRDQYLPWRQ